MGEGFIEMLKAERLTLIMSLPRNDPGLAICAWENGADVIKVHVNVCHRASKTSFERLEEEYESLKQILSDAKGPVGIVLGGDTEGAAKDFEASLNMGFDFISLYMHHTPLKILAFDHTIKMLAADYTYTMDEISEFSSMAQVLEASIIRPEEYGMPLNARDILHYRQLAVKAAMPVVVPTQKRVSLDELALLRDIGINGIMIGTIVTGTEKETVSKAIANFKKRILIL
jgi:hypothetical protein